MLQLLNYACLASDVYSNDNKTTPWNHINYPNNSAQNSRFKLPWTSLSNRMNPKNSENPLFKEQPKFAFNFFARLYANILTHETVIAYRGTTLNRHSLQADMSIVLNQWSNYDEQARNFYIWSKSFLNHQTNTNYSRFPVIIGHSLGGYLAQIIGVEYADARVITFNAPGIGRLFNPYVGYIDPSNKQYQKNIYNFYSSTDLIHHIGESVGNKSRLPDHATVAFSLTSNLFEIAETIYQQLYMRHTIDAYISIIEYATAHYLVG